ncbi:YuiA family protein [Alkalicoccus halolimnae]|uniref:YuiA family protein n=1 Tax=Alkalicoccus halolimnae TaxID=1667239 RepID=A0AAJ8LV65_9BACI|nr:YuiA family protein [Alkalicoccus halolimnae]
MYQRKRLKRSQCSYCTGRGYHQLLLGGSETCSSCHGTGKAK